MVAYTPNHLGYVGNTANVIKICKCNYRQDLAIFPNYKLLKTAVNAEGQHLAQLLKESYCYLKKKHRDAGMRDRINCSQ